MSSRNHERPVSNLAKAYGALWRASGYLTPQVIEARRLLRDLLARDEQRAGIAWAMTKFGEFTEGEILRMGVENGLLERDISPDAVERTLRENWGGEAGARKALRPPTTGSGVKPPPTIRVSIERASS